MYPLSNGTNGNDKTPRHPRWTRSETMVLIEGKRIADGRGRRRGRRSDSDWGSTRIEPKWDSVSSHCIRNGVTRGPVQCRKRWSNLVSDFRKIKTWEDNNVVNEESDSYWMMRSDLRREIKLPGFFDREIFDVLDGKAFAADDDAYRLALVPINSDENNGGDDGGVEVEDEDEENEEENERSPLSSPVPISEMKYQPFHQAESSQDAENKRKPGPHFCEGTNFQEGVKRRRRQSLSDSRNTDVEELLVKALERNTNLLNAHFDEQKLNLQLDREQQKIQHDSLIAALTKITDALEKIANKL